jgi:hypothetical protein
VRHALQTRDGAVRFRCSSPSSRCWTAPRLLSASGEDRHLSGALTSDSSSGRGRSLLKQATRVRLPHRTPCLCRWIRRQVYEASQEGSIPSRGATNCPRPRIGRRPSEGRYVEVRLLAGAPPETCWECKSGNADDVRNGRALIRRCYVRSTRTVGTRFPRTHTAVR